LKKLFCHSDFRHFEFQIVFSFRVLNFLKMSSGFVFGVNVLRNYEVLAQEIDRLLEELQIIVRLVSSSLSKTSSRVNKRSHAGFLLPASSTLAGMVASRSAACEPIRGSWCGRAVDVQTTPHDGSSWLNALLTAHAA